MILTTSFCVAACVAALLLLNARVIGTGEIETALSVPPMLSVTSREKTLPAIVPETDLLVVKMGSYEGPFLENNSQRYILDAALLEVKNIGNCLLRNAVIRLSCGEESWTFELTFLPPGETVLVLEKYGNSCEIVTFTEIVGTQIEDILPDGGLSKFEVIDLEMGKTLIKKLAGEDTDKLHLYYKSTLEDGKYFVGGITYSYPLGELNAGETVIINLPNYAMGSSKVVAIQ